MPEPDYYKKHRTQILANQKKRWHIKNPDAKSYGYINHLFICKKCNRVWEVYVIPGIKELQIMYMDDGFPKYQDMRTCPNCEKKEINN